MYNNNIIYILIGGGLMLNILSLLKSFLNVYEDDMVKDFKRNYNTRYC